MAAWGPEPERAGARESRPNGAANRKSKSPARRSLYKFHESFEPYIFSLSSRFARHVLLKYDNFTRGPAVPLLPLSVCLLFLSRFAAREMFICFCLKCLRVKLDSCVPVYSSHFFCIVRTSRRTPPPPRNNCHANSVNYIAPSV